MQIDEQKIDEAMLALLYLTLHDGCRAWKSFDWDAMNHLYEKGFIDDPVNKAKSVVLTEQASQRPSGSSRHCSKRNSSAARLNPGIVRPPYRKSLAALKAAGEEVASAPAHGRRRAARK